MSGIRGPVNCEAFGAQEPRDEGAWFAAALLPISLLPTLLGLTGAVYLVGATALGLMFVSLAGVMHIRGPSERLAARLFTGSIIYLPVLLVLMGLVIAALLLSLYMPLFQLSGLQQG